MGVWYFECKPGRGKFAILTSLKLDKRNKKLPGNRPFHFIDKKCNYFNCQ